MKTDRILVVTDEYRARAVVGLNMSSDATGKIFFNAASGLMIRPSESLFFLMYAQIALVTSVRGMVFLPQMATSDSDKLFGAKMPLPAFFIARARLEPAAFAAALARFFTGFPVAFEIFGPVAFVVFVAFVIVGFVVVVMSAGECCLVQSSSQDQRVAQPHCRLSAITCMGSLTRTTQVLHRPGPEELHGSC